MSKHSPETSEKLPVHELLIQVATSIREISLPPTLNEASLEEMTDIWYKLISAERVLWNLLDDDKLEVRQKGELRALLSADFNRVYYLPSVLALFRTVLQMYEPKFFNPVGAEKIAQNMQKLALNISQLAHKIERLAQTNDSF